MPSSKKPCVLSLSNPPIRLSRPGSSTIRVIPPLRGLGREFTCRWTGCGARLFSLVNIVREDMLPEPGHQDGVGACEGGGGGAQAEAKESDFGGAGAGAGAGDSKMDVDDDFTPHTSEAKSHSQAPPPTARASGAKSFGFGDDDTAAGRSSGGSSSGSGMDVVCVSPQAPARVSDNRFPLPHLNVPSQGTVHAAGRGPVAGTSRLSAQESPRIAVPPSPSLSSKIPPPSSSSSISSGGRVVIPSLATGLIGHGGNVWSPGSSRPQSAERRRWMARMSLLRDKRDTTHDNGDAKVTQVALADDATVHSYDGGTGKYVHLEHLPWMGQELLDGALEEGDISCPQCKHVIGSWSWNPHPRHTMGGRLQVPVIRVLRTTVTEAELGLDATPITTPRLPDDSPRLGGSRGNSAHSTPRDPAARPSSGRSQSGGGGGTPRTPRGVLLNAAAAEAK